MISIKPGAKLSGMAPELSFVLMVLKDIFAELDAELIITEITGGKHSANSLHYQGLAADLRSKHLNSERKIAILMKAGQILGEHCDMILEFEGQLNEHFHIEYQPKLI